ncbi:MAG: c-type cytochrome [Chloroflexi bacterium SZAS-1]|nr:c-type cytochrome [Chloroflexi bacterium SZAS-1]
MRILRWLGIGVGVIVGLLLIAVAGVYVASSARLNKTYKVPEEQIAIPNDAASIERGRYLVTTVGQCVDCHGENLAGREFLNAPGIIRAVSANLTAGKGGVGARFSDADWVRAIRHGVTPEGRPLLIMPSQNYNQLSAQDLGAIIAYVKTVPPVDQEPGTSQVQLFGRALFVVGQIDALAAERIDHSAPAPAPIVPGATSAYGNYLVTIGGCADCHGAALAGGLVPGAPPSAPPAANLTPQSELSGWTDADFIQTMRTGVNPAGKHLNAFMPYKYIGLLSDDELRAIYLYLQTIPPQTMSAK